MLYTNEESTDKTHPFIMVLVYTLVALNGSKAIYKIRINLGLVCGTFCRYFFVVPKPIEYSEILVLHPVTIICSHNAHVQG